MLDIFAEREPGILCIANVQTFSQFGNSTEKWRIDFMQYMCPQIDPI